MTSQRRRLLVLWMLVFATTVQLIAVADDPADPADLPAPMSTSKSEEADLLDDFKGPVEPIPYHGLIDDPETPMARQTVMPFAAPGDDIEPFNLLERPGIPVGWFAGLELTAANPRVSTRQQSGNLLGGNPISVPFAPLDWTAMPKLTLGYRRPDGLGELSASYRFLISNGSESTSQFGGTTGTASSRLNLQVLDLDYSLSDLFPNDLWLVPRQIRLTGGVRVAGIYDKSTAAGGTILGQTASNTFVGAGPRVAIESMYPIASGRWTLFTKFDAAGVIGSDRQSFNQTIGGVPITSTSATSQPSTVAVPVVGVRAGLNWLPEWGGGNVKMSTGYQWERWFDLGTDPNSYNELTIQGPFLRGEVAF